MRTRSSEQLAVLETSPTLATYRTPSVWNQQIAEALRYRLVKQDAHRVQLRLAHLQEQQSLVLG